MTLTPRLTAKRLSGSTVMLERIVTHAPRAVAAILARIEDGAPDERPKAEDAGIRSKGGHSDPTARDALSGLGATERHLKPLEDDLGAMVAAMHRVLGHIELWCFTGNQHDVQPDPRCTGGRSVEEWSNPACSNFVSYTVRNDGTRSIRSDGLCDACRMRKYRWERKQGEQGVA